MIANTVGMAMPRRLATTSSPIVEAQCGGLQWALLLGIEVTSYDWIHLLLNLLVVVSTVYPVLAQASQASLQRIVCLHGHLMHWGARGFRDRACDFRHLNHSTAGIHARYHALASLSTLRRLLSLQFVCYLSTL